MVGWIIFGILVLILVLILIIPVGADFRYEDEVIRFSIKIAGIRLQLIPKPKKEAKEEKPPKEKKEKKEKPPKSESEEPKKKRSLPFNAEEIFEIIKAVLKGFGRFGRKFKVDRFVLHWIAPMWNPYISARIFAVVNAGMSELTPICTERFHCRDTSVWTDIDFTREDMFLEFGLALSIRIGQILGTVLRIAFAVLWIYLKSKRRVKRENKEEEAALAVWLKEHPEDAALLQEDQEVA